MIKKIPDNEYFAIDALSASGLKELLKTPAHFKVFNYGSTPTPAMRLGTIVHALILGGMENIVAYDGKSLGSKKAHEFIVQHEGKTVVTSSEMDLARQIVDYQRDKSIMDWFAQTENEIAIVVDLDDKIKLKCKYDSLYRERMMGIDVKTTSSLDQFEKRFFRFGYHIQEAFYRFVAKAAGYDVQDFIFWAVETSPPFESKCFRVDEEVHDYAMDQVQRGLELYKHCLKENSWPGYNGDIHTIQLPGYLKHE